MIKSYKLNTTKVFNFFFLVNTYERDKYLLLVIPCLFLVVYVFVSIKHGFCVEDYFSVPVCAVH